MSADPANSRDPQNRESSRFKPHEFRWDPFESARLALRGRAPGKKLAAAGAIALVSVGLLGATMIGSGRSDASASADAQTKRLAELDAQVKQREAEVATLERRRAAAKAEIADSGKRIAALETRRADLQKQVAELTAPVAPADEVRDEASAQPPQDQPIDSAGSPPDEAPGDDGRLATSSRSGPDAASPSSATVEQASVETTAAAPVEAVHSAGPVRVFIHIRTADRAARERARAIAAELERKGVAVAEIRGVVRPVPRDAVRFYYDDDRQAVTTLQDAVRRASPADDPAPQAQDFRGYRAPPKPGTLELWLS